MVSEIHTFLGHSMLLSADGGELVWCNWVDHGDTSPCLLDAGNSSSCPPDRVAVGCGDKSVGDYTDRDVLRLAVRQLEEYFAGCRRQFSVPLRIEGTGFQKRVWNALLEIPFGATVTYGELARIIGSPKGCRAVAQACGANHIDVIIPCHRVTAAGGLQGGYTGPSGVKSALLALEKGSRDQTVPETE